MTLTIEEAKDFYVAAEKTRKPWLAVAEKSWGEIKREADSRSTLSVKKRQRYPAWYSIFKIRQSLVLSRIGIPIGKDTSEAGEDGVGATAALLKERLAKNLVKTFDYFDVLCSARDDFLATNLGNVRAYYERDTIKERVKDRLSMIQAEDGSQQFVDSAGEIVTDDSILQDDEGYFLYRSEVVDVENERVCLEPVLYKDVRFDPDCRRWNRCKRVAFDIYLSKHEFVEMFGRAAFRELSLAERARDEEAWAKCRTIKVIEYWDEYEKQVYYWAENGTDFIKPLAYYQPTNPEDLEIDDRNGIYDLPKFFPMPPPLVINAPTDDFFPIPEYTQLKDIIDEIHTLFGRMVGVTNAIRPIILADANIDNLVVALREGIDGDVFGVPNLAQALVNAGGKLSNVAQYLDIQPLVDSLGTLYGALEQRLNTLYRLTGTSDLLQGLQADMQRDRTLGESQMLEKYALNQMAEPQRKMAEFVRDCYELLCDMAVKNFKEESLDVYLLPQTLSPEHQARYIAAKQLLRDNTKRFRIELETDSTIAINEQYDQAVRAEFVKIMSDAMEKASSSVNADPATRALNLRVMKYYVQGQRGAKLFQTEFTTAIDEQIKAAEEAAKNAEPPFDKDQAELAFKNQELQARMQLDSAKLNTDAQLKTLQIQSQERLESIRLQQEAAISNIQTQIDTFKIQSEAAQGQTDASVQLERIRADISTAQQELALKRDALIVEMQKASGEQGLEEFRAMLAQQKQEFDAALAVKQQELEERLGMLDEQEKLWTEQRLQQEHELEKVRTRVETLATIKELTKPPEMPPITVNVEGPKAKKTKKKFNVKRDADGNLMSVEAEESGEGE